MALPQPGASIAPPHFAHAGLRGGAARPSTDYACQRIRQMADLCAAQLLRGADHIDLRLDRPVTPFLDGLFLQVLQRRPDQEPALFTARFRNAPADGSERFLSGSAAPIDRVSLIVSLPHLAAQHRILFAAIVWFLLAIFLFQLPLIWLIIALGPLVALLCLPHGA